MDISSNNVTVENAGALTGNPAVNITGDGVTFVNKSGASVIGYPAIAIRGQGVKIVNEAGALIRGASEPGYGYRYLAIDGSNYSDIVVNHGKIVNDIQLHGGNDRYEVFVTAENNILGNPLAWLGEGDDIAIFHLDGIANLNGVETIAGAGYDTLRFEGITSTFIQTNIADQFERVEFVGTGQSSYVSLAYISGVQEFVLSPGLTLMLGNGSTRGRNPTATVFLNGGNLELSYTHNVGAVTGTDSAERVIVEGAVLGDVSTGGGNDRVAVQSEAWSGTVYGVGSIAGNVYLGAGDDVFDLGGYFYGYWGPNGSGNSYAPGGTVAGIVDGGEGNDTLVVYALDGRTFDLSRFTGFEQAFVAGGAGGNVRLTKLESASSVLLSVKEGGRVAIADTQAPGLVLKLDAYSGATELTIEADSTIGGITRSIPLYYGESGSQPDKNLTVRNAGAITGDVHLWSGHDYFDGRLGSVGGTIFGLAGNDIILVGAGGSADGGSGNDLIEGTAGADRLDGGRDNDILRGGAGDDRLSGGGEDDRLYGGDGDDVLTESAGLHDALYGGSGNDVLELGREAYSHQPGGSFILDGGDGDDLIRVSAGFSNNSHVDIDAGAGADRITLEYVAGTTYVRLGSGADTLFMDVLLADGWPGWKIRMLDFAAGDGGDRIDLADRPALREAFINWDGATDMFAAGMLRLVQRGGDTHLEGDIHGWGFTRLLVFANTDARSFTASNFSGYQPVVVDIATLHEGTAGADDLGGGSGDDIYLVNHPDDVFAEYSYKDIDEVRTALPTYVLREYVEILRGTSDAGQDLRGNYTDNVVTAGAGNDVLRLQEGGSDVAFGGAGNDQIYYGAAFTAADANDGGADVDVVILQGNYAVAMGANSLVNVEYLSLQSGASTRYGGSGGNSYSYDITFVDANVAAGQRFTVNASQLLAGESFTFNGASETNGSFLIYSGHGVDRLTGGSGNDLFHFEGARWGADDKVDGGNGADALIIRGSGGMNAIVFGETQLTGIEAITVSDRFALGPAGRPSYDFKLANGNVAPGGVLILNGNTLLDPTQVFHVDGGAILGGSLKLYGGAGDDRMIGGAGDDVFYSAGGQDTLKGGGGRDIFQLRSLADSSTANPDKILDFASGADLIDLHFLDADLNAAGDQSFSFIGDRAFTGISGELRAFDTGLGYWKVEGDVDGDGLADFALDVGPIKAPLVSSDFIL